MWPCCSAAVPSYTNYGGQLAVCRADGGRYEISWEVWLVWVVWLLWLVWLVWLHPKIF